MQAGLKATKGEGSVALAFVVAAAFAGIALLPVTALLDLKRASGLFAAALLAAGLALRASAGRQWRQPDAGLDRLLALLVVAWLVVVMASQLQSGISLRGPLLSGGLVLAFGLSRAPEALRQRVQACWRWALLAVAAYALLQRLGLEPIRAYAVAGSYTRAMSSFGNAGYLAAFLCLSWPSLLVWQGRRRSSALVLVAVALLATDSRAGVLAVFGQGALLAWWSWPELDSAQRRTWTKRLGTGLVVAAILVALWWRPTLRLQAWALGLHVFAQHPLFGWGPGSFAIAAEPLLSPKLLASLAASRQYIEDPHQVFILVLAEGGLLGLAVFVTAIVQSLRLTWRRSRLEAQAFALGALGLLLQSCFDRFFFSAGVLLPLFALLGLAVAEAGPPAVPRPRWTWIAALASLSLIVWVIQPLKDWRVAVQPQNPRLIDSYKAEADLESQHQRLQADASADDWDRLGAAEASQGRYQSAWAAYSRSLALEPTSGRAQNMGNCLMMLGQAPAAVPYFQRAVQLNASSADAWFSLGYGLFKARQVKAAVEALDEALRLQPGHPEASKLKEQILQ